MCAVIYKKLIKNKLRHPLSRNYQAQLANIAEIMNQRHERCPDSGSHDWINSPLEICQCWHFGLSSVSLQAHIKEGLFSRWNLKTNWTCSVLWIVMKCLQQVHETGGWFCRRRLKTQRVPNNVSCFEMLIKIFNMQKTIFCRKRLNNQFCTHTHTHTHIHIQLSN